jgi:hypothetical protein
VAAFGNPRRTRSTLIRVTATTRKILTLLGAAFSSSCFLFPPGTPVDFCIRQAELYCDMQFNCCTATERQRDPLGVFTGAPTARWAPSSQGECVDVMADVCRAGAEQQNVSLAEERITYDGDEAVDCLETMATAVAECNMADFFEAQGTYLAQLLDNGQPGILGDGCDNAIEGAVEENDDCFAQYECESGACVNQSVGDEFTLEGECQGDGKPQNPFDAANIEFEICDGLDDEA